VVLFTYSCQKVAMGKNKIDSVFKVAGAKGFKLKTKAKAVRTELKQINMKNKSKITEMDKELVKLQEKIRHATPDDKKIVIKTKSKLPSTIQNSDEVKKTSQEALDQLNSMEL
jgi:23S rRNA pseudoU1915 N3-methylase RlmH